MALRDYYAPLHEAVDATFGIHRRPVGSHEVFAWLERERPNVIQRLRDEGRRDAHDPARTGWSWRTYLANALVRMAREGLVELRGHSSDTPPGYFGPVGLWAPVRSGEALDTERQPLTVKLDSMLLDRLGKCAEESGFTVQSLIEQSLRQNPVIIPGFRVERDPAVWLDFLTKAIGRAQRDAGVLFPCVQRDLIRFSTALAMRLAERLDRPARQWRIAASPTTTGGVRVPEDLLHRLEGALTPEGTLDGSAAGEEGSDFVVFTQADGREWPLVAMESEGAHWYETGPDYHWNDYLWDFYKLFGRKSAAMLMVARVSGHDGVRPPERMRALAETLDETAYRTHAHLLVPGQPVLIVLVPSGRASLLLGAAVAPGPILWEEV